MINWLEGLSTFWLVLFLFAATAAVAAAIFLVVMRTARGSAGSALATVSPGLLSPMGLVFGLIVGFLVAGLWSDLSNARDAGDSEASALRSTVLVADAAFPGERANRIAALVRQHIHDAATQEWPAMRNGRATLKVVPGPLAQALALSLRFDAPTAAKATAQRELVTAIQNALDARRQRIIISQASVSWVKWLGVILLAGLTMVAIACVHSANRFGAAIAMGIFAAAVAVTLVLIASQARPFSGEFGIKPDVSAAGGPAVLAAQGLGSLTFE